MFELRHSFDVSIDPANKWRIWRLEIESDLLPGDLQRLDLRKISPAICDRGIHARNSWPGSYPGELFPVRVIRWKSGQPVGFSQPVVEVAL